MELTWEQVCKTVIEYFQDNEWEYDDVIQELDGYTNILTDHGLGPNCPMEDINDLYYGDPIQALLDAMSGDDWAYGHFDPDREYFFQDANGLHSTDDRWLPDTDYTDLLDDDFVTALYQYRNNYYDLPEPVNEIFETWAKQEGDV
jgi:hypothetical protein